MQYRVHAPDRRSTLVIALLTMAAIMLAFGTTPSAWAQQAAATFPMTVTQNRVPGASGQVTVTPVGTNQLRVDIQIMGLPPTPSTRAAHIHTAPGAVCDNNAPVTYPLSDVTIDSTGMGTSTTTITLTPDKPITANNAYVNVHEQASPPGQGVICANITQSYGASGTSSSGTTVSASSSGSSSATSPAMTSPGAATMVTISLGTAAESGQVAAPATGMNGCQLSDSWCAYCTRHSDADLCKQNPPGPTTQTR